MISIKFITHRMTFLKTGLTEFKFHVLFRDSSSRARIGEIVTGHGRFQTPAFMPVGTAGSVKALSSEDLEKIGVDIILANTYHLYLRPGHETIERLGGLHRFMSWNKPILTDSGGYQVYSLAPLRKITPDGVVFRSHLDGSTHILSPERVMEIQSALGSDITMAFDECIPYGVDYKYAKESVSHTTMWAKRCVENKKRSDQALFGIIQGGVYRDLRKKSALELGELPMDGYALGGLCIGEPRDQRFDIIGYTMDYISQDKPVYLMGAGKPDDILDAVSMGVDLFDCVIPTRNARNGTLFTRNGKISIKSSRFKEDPDPVDKDCSCYTCRNYSRAYLRHLFISKELLSYRLNTIHNVSFYINLMYDIRNALSNGDFLRFSEQFKARFYQNDN